MSAPASIRDVNALPPALVQKLVRTEWARSFDDGIDFVHGGVDGHMLVDWPRFHRLYHRGRLRVRVVNRRGLLTTVLITHPSDSYPAHYSSVSIEEVDINSVHTPPILTELRRESVDPGSWASYAHLIHCHGGVWELVSRTVVLCAPQSLFCYHNPVP